MEGNAAHAEHVDLAEKFAEVAASFVPHGHIAQMAYAEIVATDACAHVDVLGKHLPESSHPFIDAPAESHVECARHEFLKLDFSAAYTSCGEERCHGEVDGFLRVGERFVGGIGTSEAVERSG